MAAVFARQAAGCRRLGSAFTAAVCDLIARDGLPDGMTYRRIAGWLAASAAGAGGDAVALRLCGAFHRLVLDDVEPALTAAYPPNPLDEIALGRAISAAIRTHDDFVADYLASPPQTNEVARSAVILPALLALAKRHGRPIRMLEIGASAGLNRNLDRFRYDYGGWHWGDENSPVAIACEWRGATFSAPEAQLHIAEGLGCDIAPVPITTEDDRRRLQSYIWPDQPHRLDRLRAALAVASAHPPDIDKADAASWLEHRLVSAASDTHTVIWHTIMWQYVPDAEKARIETCLRDAGRDASPDRPVSWVRLEADGRSDSAALLVTDWSGRAGDGITRVAARGDFHGRWIDWHGL